MSTLYHGPRVSFGHAVVVAGVYEFKDVSGPELDGHAAAQHRSVRDPLSIHKRLGIQTDRGHGHQSVRMHQVTVVRQNPRPKQLRCMKKNIIIFYYYY